jgi:hypothetical protein
MTARWIAMEDMPLDAVENKHFCDMIMAHDADAKTLPLEGPPENPLL